MPYSLALSALNSDMERIWGKMRVVAAGATRILPGLAQFIRGIDGVNADRVCVDKALTQGNSIAVSPGGISEMFLSYPKPGISVNQEIAQLSNRKGFIRLSHKHGIPVIPCYVFGSSKLMKRMDFYGAEWLSRIFRASLTVIWGRWGLPVPFRVVGGLVYVVGRVIYPGRNVEEVRTFEGGSVVRRECDDGVLFINSAFASLNVF